MDLGTGFFAYTPQGSGRRGRLGLSHHRKRKPPSGAAFFGYSPSANTTIFAVFLSTGQIGEFVPATNATRWVPSMA
jgi:hypothetical protein